MSPYAPCAFVCAWLWACLYVNFLNNSLSDFMHLNCHIYKPQEWDQSPLCFYLISSYLIEMIPVSRLLFFCPFTVSSSGTLRVDPKVREKNTSRLWLPDRAGCYDWRQHCEAVSKLCYSSWKCFTLQPIKRLKLVKLKLYMSGSTLLWSDAEFSKTIIASDCPRMAPQLCRLQAHWAEWINRARYFDLRGSVLRLSSGCGRDRERDRAHLCW